MPQLTVGGTWLTLEQRNALEATAASIATPGKGITACDESAGTIGARMAKVGIENTEENRRKYRQMLFEAPGANAFLSGAILDPETLYQVSCPSPVACNILIDGVILKVTTNRNPTQMTKLFHKFSLKEVSM
jgi:fructose-bisphosphate aldolase class 1